MSESKVSNRPGREFPERVDVVVVGSGPAGAAYARVLSERAPGAEVLVLEAGPQVTSPPGAHVKNIEDPVCRARAQLKSEGPSASEQDPGDMMLDYASDETRLHRPGTFLLQQGWRSPGEDGMPAAAMSSNVGGMGAHWTGACPRPGQSECIDFVEDMQQLLDEAERLLAVTSVELARAPLSAEVRSRLGASLDADRPADRQVQPMPLAVRRNPDGGLIWSGSDVVFGEVIRTNPHVRLMDESMVVRVLEEDGSVRGVVVRDQTTGEHHTVRSDFVVVAADSLRTPQLLFASGIRLPALGRFLNDQPQVVHAVRLRNVGDAGIASAKDVEITEQSGVAWVPFTDDEPFHGQVMQLDASPVPLEGDVVPGSVVGLGWFCAKDLQETDRLEFDAEEVDDYGMPAMRIHYTLTQRDRATIDRAKRAIVRVGDSLGESLGEPIEFPPGASLHYQGTVRMGPIDDGTSVCDKNSQVWGIKGLHVAGNGVIPTATACNPTLTNVALAVRGATSIANQLHAEVEKEEIHA